MSNDLGELPLKRSVETFVDEPSSLEEVSLDELMFDFKNNIKDINRLHVFHAIAIVTSTLENIIKLHKNPELFHKFRQQELTKYNLTVPDSLKDLPNFGGDFNDASNDSIASTSSSNQVIDDSPVLPPLKCARFNQNFEDSSSESLKESTPDSLSNDRNESSTENLVDSHSKMNHDTPAHSDEFDEEVTIIPIETLVANTSLDKINTPITSLSNEKLQKELDYFQDARTNIQIAHLVKSFNLLKVPKISVEDFLIRIKTYSSSISVSSYIHSAFMLFKLSVLFAAVPLSYHNVYRLLLASIRCSTKKLEDVYQKQKAFATVGGVSQKELYKIEVGFLYLCNFKVITGEAILNKFLTSDFIDLLTFCSHHFKE